MEEWIGDTGAVYHMTDKDVSAELQDVVYVPNLGYNLFSPSDEFDGKTWNHIVGPKRV